MNKYKQRIQQAKSWLARHSGPLALALVAVYGVVALASVYRSSVQGHFLQRAIPGMTQEQGKSSSKKPVKRGSSSSRQRVGLRPAAPAQASSKAVKPLRIALIDESDVPSFVADEPVLVQSSISSAQSSSEDSSIAGIPLRSSSFSSVSRVQNGCVPFDHSVFPVTRAPNWGAMRTPEEWNKPYTQLSREDFVPIPAYNINELTKPLKELLQKRSENEDKITAKLFYSTRYFGQYDLDSGEYEWEHAGVDIKLALGTPLRAIGGGIVDSVSSSAALGRHVIIKHCLGENVYYSIYGHMDEVWVQEGQILLPGHTIGTVGMTGNTSGPHLHLQIDKAQTEGKHTPYWPNGTPSSAQVGAFTTHPIRFIQEHITGE